jgi:hypothetical protein
MQRISTQVREHMPAAINVTGQLLLAFVGLRL